MMLRLRPVSTAVFLSLMTSSLPLAAQSLVSMLESAKRVDASYLSAQAQLEASRYRSKQSTALWLPQVGLQGTWAKTGNTATTQSTSQTSVGGVTTDQSSTRTESDTDSTTKQLALNLQQNIYNRANNISIDQADEAFKMAQVAATAAQQDLSVRVAQAYFDLLVARESVALLAAQKKAVSVQLAAAKRNFEVGNANVTETKDAQARYDLIEAQDIVARNDELLKSRALDQLTGLQQARPWSLASMGTDTPLSGSEADWVGRAREQSPQVQLKKIESTIAQWEVDKAKAGHWPTLALVGSLTRNQPSGQTTSTSVVDTSIRNGAPVSVSANNLGTSAPGNSTTKYVGVVLNVPVFSGFATHNRVNEAAALLEKTRAELDGAQAAAAQQVRSAYFGVQAGSAQVKALQAAAASSQSALDAVTLGYKVGAKISLDVLNAQTQLYQTQRDLARAKYDTLLAHLRLKQAVGQLEDSDVARVNALLNPESAPKP